LQNEFFAMLSAVQDWAGFEMVGFDYVFDLPELSELSGPVDQSKVMDRGREELRAA
jgi:hypothetical protein